MELIVPPDTGELFPTLGDQLCDFLEERACHGPGDLKGAPLVLGEDWRYVLYRSYEVWPRGHPRAGKRRFKRVAVSWRKGSAKTEFMALVAFLELHPEAPVRFNGFDDNAPCGLAPGRPVVDPYIPLVATSANGATSWFLFANPSVTDRAALEFARLRGHEEPDQDRDDGDHHQELDEGEAGGTRPRLSPGRTAGAGTDHT